MFFPFGYTTYHLRRESFYRHTNGGYLMQQYEIIGMSCAACSARVEKAVSRLPGVNSCTVNLLTNSMTVDGDASTDTIISAVKHAGYGAALRNPTAAAGPGIAAPVSGAFFEAEWHGRAGAVPHPGCGGAA